VPVHPSTRQALDDHLSQAEFALRVAGNFECLQGTPAHDSVRAALARVGEARGWVKAQLVVQLPSVKPPNLAYQSVRERRQIVMRRMARLAP
jgi:hypothetical protein